MRRTRRGIKVHRSGRCMKNEYTKESKEAQRIQLRLIKPFDARRCRRIL
jgi:hypothetical protein